MKSYYLATLSAALLLSACGGQSDQATGDETAVGEQGMGQGQISGSGPDELASCYELTEAGIDPLAPKRELFVLIDKTTAFDERLVDQIKTLISDYAGKEPLAISIGSFSAQTSDEFTRIEYRGEAERKPTEAGKSEVPMRRLENLERCLGQQQGELIRQAVDTVDTITSRSSGTYANSEVLRSLNQLADAVRNSPATEKSVLIASDMLEHSSAMTFYEDKGIRLFDWQEALQIAADNRMLADFGGAQIAVIGAGALPPDEGSEAVRNPAKLNNLRTFWENWFANSEGELDESHYGEPDLMVGL